MKNVCLATLLQQAMTNNLQQNSRNNAKDWEGKFKRVALEKNFVYKNINIDKLFCKKNVLTSIELALIAV